MTKGIIVALMCSLLLGCDDPLFCDEERMTLEVMYGDELSREWYELSRDIGWKCNLAGAIRNAFGTEIGQRYDCTICR